MGQSLGGEENINCDFHKKEFNLSDFLLSEKIEIGLSLAHEKTFLKLSAKYLVNHIVFSDSICPISFI